MLTKSSPYWWFQSINSQQCQCSSCSTLLPTPTVISLFDFSCSGCWAVLLPGDLFNLYLLDNLFICLLAIWISSPITHPALLMTSPLGVYSLMVNWITALKDVHALIPRSCEYATFHGKRDFTDVIKLKFLRWKDYPGLSSWAQDNYMSADKSEAGGSKLEQEDITIEAEVRGYTGGFAGGGMGPWAKDCRWLLEAGKSKEMNSSLDPPREHRTANTLILAQQNWLRTSDLQNYEIIYTFALATKYGNLSQSQ